jgi:hypothetical protein
MTSFAQENISNRAHHDATAERSDAGALHTTRRDAIRLAAGGAGLALIAAGLRGPAALAAQGTPAPVVSKEGLYVVVRSRVVKPDMSIDELNTAIRDGLVPLIEAIPGFVEYYVVQNPDTRDRTAVSIFTDKQGADESTAVASDFISGEGGLADYYEDVEPVVLEGAIVVATA